MADIYLPIMKHHPFKRLKKYIQSIYWPSDTIVQNIAIPTLFITGDADEVIPYEQTVELHKIATSSNFNQLLVIEGGNHFGSYMRNPKAYFSKFEAFL